MLTNCDDCQSVVTLDVYEDQLIGGECSKCGYYTTRYTRAFKEEADWL